MPFGSWSASTLISWARQGDQAAGPAARASASVSARSIRSTSARPSTAATRASSVSRVGVVSAGRERRPGSDGGGLAARRDPRLSAAAPSSPRSPGDRGTDRGVVGRRACGSFPMSWKRQASSSRSGRSTRVRCGCASATAWTECRSTVCRWIGLCCGRARIGSQSGIQRVMQPARSSASQTGIRFWPAGQHLEQRLARLVRPRRVDHGSMPAEIVGGDRGEHQPLLGGERAGAQPEQRGRRLGVPVQPDLALMHDQPVRSLRVRRLALSADEGQHPSLGQDLTRGPDGQVDRVPDPSSGERDLAVQRVGVGEPEPVRDLARPRPPAAGPARGRR